MSSNVLYDLEVEFVLRPKLYLNGTPIPSIVINKETFKCPAFAKSSLMTKVVKSRPSLKSLSWTTSSLKSLREKTETRRSKVTKKVRRVPRATWKKKR